MPLLAADLLGDHHRQQEQHRGRTACQAERQPPSSRAQRCVARGIRAEKLAQEQWAHTGCRANKMIKVVIEEGAKTFFKVPVSAIYESNIHNLLKNRQVVVRN
jgi:hypothetical protein